jgi:predicted pyridoxine 5'-phosphate oxidase superfamily flavin-nucleotide-binding protein
VNQGTGEGYQFKGTSVLVTEGPEFEEAEKKRGRPIKALVKINVEEIYNLKPGEKAGERIA